MMLRAGRRAGLTLIELLVVVSIVGLLAALLIPAVQSSREAARATACRNNLRQVALAVLNHESSNGALPALYNGRFLPRPRTAIDEFHFHSWRSALLPGVERSDVYNALNLDMPSSTFANQTGLNAAISTFVCPSAANPTRDVPDVFSWEVTASGGKLGERIGSAGRTDYEAVGGVRDYARAGGTLGFTEFGAWGEPKYQGDTNVALSYRTARLADVTDGLSNTVLIGERAGRPDCYSRAKGLSPYPHADLTAGCGDIAQSAWGMSTHFPWLVFGADQSVNHTNATGFYTFHPSGAMATLGDGSVRSLRESTAPAVLKALATRAGGEVVASGF